jgi:hypothetical protein
VLCQEIGVNCCAGLWRQVLDCAQVSILGRRAQMQLIRVQGFYAPSVSIWGRSFGPLCDLPGLWPGNRRVSAMRVSLLPQGFPTPPDTLHSRYRARLSYSRKGFLYFQYFLYLLQRKRENEGQSTRPGEVLASSKVSEVSEVSEKPGRVGRNRPIPCGQGIGHLGQGIGIRHQRTVKRVACRSIPVSVRRHWPPGPRRTQLRSRPRPRWPRHPRHHQGARANHAVYPRP